MFANFDDDVMPTQEGMDSLVNMGMCSPEAAMAMKSAAMLRGRLPAAYRMVGYSDDPRMPWIMVAAKWDGQPIEGDVSAELREVMAPLEVRDPSFSDGMFSWAVASPDENTWAEAESSPRGRRRAAQSEVASE